MAVAPLTRDLSSIGVLMTVAVSQPVGKLAEMLHNRQLSTSGHSKIGPHCSNTYQVDKTTT